MRSGAGHQTQAMPASVTWPSMRWPTVYFVIQLMTYNPEWRAEDEKRVRTLECLYMVDGRHDPKHPDHMTFTGLWQKYREQQASE